MQTKPGCGIDASTKRGKFLTTFPPITVMIAHKPLSTSPGKFAVARTNRNDCY